MNKNFIKLVSVAIPIAIFFLYQNKRKEDDTMAMLYAVLIIRNRKNFSEVPETLKAKVREYLIEAEAEHLIEETLAE